MRAITAEATLLLLALCLGTVPTVSVAASQVAGPVSLVLSVIPPKLPADGQSYGAVVVSLINSSGLPVVAPEDLTVYLSSQLPTVADVSSNITITAGESFAVANLTTSQTPGSTTLTASASGLRTASALAQTVIPSGFPDHLVAFAVPSVQLARTLAQGEVVVQVQDDLGIPARTTSTLTVSLSSSDNGTLRVSRQTLVIPAHESVGWENYTTGLVTGSAGITASATGFSAGFATIQVVPAPPLVLRVTAEPDMISTNSTGRIVVSLTDESGEPAEAPDDLTVFLTSSNLTAVVVSGTDANLDPVSLIIPKGQVFAETTFASRAQGNATITASAHGLVAGFAQVAVDSPHRATALRLFLAPNPVPSTDQQFPAVAIGLASVLKNGTFPSVASNLIPVIVTASDNATGKVYETFTIEMEPGSSYQVGAFDSALLPSSAVITAAAENLTSAQASMTTLNPVLPIGPAPSRVVIAPVLPSLPADGDTYQGLLVNLQDSTGGPAVAPETITVHLSMNQSNILQLMTKNESVPIPAGQSFSIVMVKTMPMQGTVNVTAESPGYNSSWTLLSTKALSPAKIALYISPSPAMLSSNGEGAILAVQLQDVGGNPARAREPTAVILTSSNRTLLPLPVQASIPVFSDYALIPLKGKVDVAAVLTATSPGLAPANVSVAWFNLPVDASISSHPSALLLNGSASLSVSLFAMNLPIRNASVNWHASSGTLSSTQTTTDPDGMSSVTLVPSVPGTVQVTALVNSPITGLRNLSLALNVSPVPVVPHRSAGWPVMEYVPYIGASGAVAVLVTLFLLRRRRTSGEEEELETGFPANGAPIAFSRELPAEVRSSLGVCLVPRDRGRFLM